MPRTITKETENLMSQARTLKEVGWTERRIAANLGIPRPTINKWLKSSQVISSQSKPRLATYNYGLASENVNSFYHGDCLFVLNHDITPASIDLIYLDPPFFTGKVQKGEIWQPEAMEVSYEDSKRFWEEKGLASHTPEWLKHIARTRPDFASYLFYMTERLRACHKVLKQTGSIYLHCDWRASHYLKMLMDEVFGNDNFQNEIIWHYRSGAGTPKRFGRKHDTILFYSKTDKYLFNADDLRLPYAPATISRLKYNGAREHDIDKVLARNGRLADDVWTIEHIQGNSREAVGYPTQKPLSLLERIILASSNEGDVILDPFCGCGTAIIAARNLGRRWIGIDINSAAYDITKTRAGNIEEKQMPLGQIQDFAKALHICRDLKAIKEFNPQAFEQWVNQYYKAIKPSPDNGVDGITSTGTPIQSKTYRISYPVISQFLTDARYHPNTTKPIKQLVIVSQDGFDDSARKRKFEIENIEHIKVVLATPDNMLRIGNVNNNHNTVERK